MKVVRTWYENTRISPEHASLEVKQIYVWVISKDNMIAVVTKRNGDSQLPGGHPEKGEGNIRTAQREVYEETGLDISKYSSRSSQFGYYLIEEEGKKYLQLRYFLKLSGESQEFPLITSEKSDEERPVESAQWVDLLNLPTYIPWAKNLQEYKCATELALN